MPVYNALPFVFEAVDSALEQTYTNIEVVIVDDGSTDDTFSRLQSRYGQDHRVRLFSQANAGPSSARNKAIQESHGAYIQFLDADERLVNDKIEKSLGLFEAHPDIGVVYGHGIPVEADGVTPIAIDDPPLPSGDVLCEWINGTMAGGTYGVTGSFMVKRDALDTVGLFEPALRWAEDYDLWLRLAEVYHFAALDEKLVYYRRRADGLHKDRLNMSIGRLRVTERMGSLQRRRDCLTDEQYKRLLAQRWAVVARVYWDIGQRMNAFTHYRTAARRDRSKLYLFLAGLTLFLPSSWFDVVMSIREKLKH